MLVPALQPLSMTPSRSGGNLVLTLPTTGGYTYWVTYKDSLKDPNWKLLTTVPGDGSVKTVNDPLNRTNRFYRLFVP
jgi:hypothetical protein